MPNRKVEFIALTNTAATPMAHCTRCMKRMDRASSQGGRGPLPGDVSLCLNCGNIMLFGDDMKPRDPTPQEMQDLKRSSNWKQVKTLQEKFRNAEYAAAFDLRRKPDAES